MAISATGPSCDPCREAGSGVSAPSGPWQLTLPAVPMKQVRSSPAARRTARGSAGQGDATPVQPGRVAGVAHLVQAQQRTAPARVRAHEEVLADRAPARRRAGRDGHRRGLPGQLAVAERAAAPADDAAGRRARAGHLVGFHRDLDRAGHARDRRRRVDLDAARTPKAPWPQQTTEPWARRRRGPPEDRLTASSRPGTFVG